jgi:hypothetical protein
MLLLLSLLVQAQNFRVQNETILAPDGQEFVIKGANVNGPHWPWNRSTLQDIDLITNVWKFNTIRVNCFPSLAHIFPNNNVNLNELVNAFTARKVVVQLENHDFTGKYPSGNELENLKNWWVDLANRFKNNPYVWFNIMNEPGNEPTVDDRWKNTHDYVLKAIRATGAQNVIVLDEHGFGQGNGLRNQAAASGILKYADYFTQNYQNICFSVHLYSTWIYRQAQLDSLFTVAKQRKFSVHIGEFGTVEGYSKGVARDLFQLLLQHKIGTIFWQWDGSDTHDLTLGTTRGGAWEVNRTDGSVPTNLSFVGNLIWKYNYNILQLNSADFRLRDPWLYNGSFEDDFQEWINWGNAEVEKNTLNAKHGKNNVRVNASTNGGGMGQPLYLTPGATYRLRAWGRNSATPVGTTDLGIQYKDASGTQRYELLQFRETTYTQKEIEFTLPPAPISDMTIFIWKNDKNITFYADDIQLTIKNDPTTVVTAPVQLDFEIFPNPTGDFVIVKGIDLQNYTFQLTDSTGKIIAIQPERVANEQVKIQLHTINSGVYYLTMIFKEYHLIKKIIVIK